MMSGRKRRPNTILQYEGHDNMDAMLFFPNDSVFWIFLGQSSRSIVVVVVIDGPGTARAVHTSVLCHLSSSSLLEYCPFCPLSVIAFSSLFCPFFVLEYCPFFVRNSNWPPTKSYFARLLRAVWNRAGRRRRRQRDVVLGGRRS